MDRPFAPLTVPRRFALLLALLSPALGSLAAQGIPPGLAFDGQGTSTYDGQTGIATATGGARLTYQGSVLTADEIRFNTKTGEASARGNVRLLSGARLMLADELAYRINEQSFDARGLRMGEAPLYLSAARASGTRENVVLEDATVSYEKPGPFAPTITASRVTYTGGRDIRAQGVRLGIGAAQPIFLPTFNRNLSAPFFSDLTATGGYRASLGAFLVAGLELPVMEQLDLGGQLGFYTQRGLLAGPTASYRVNGGDGFLRTGYIHDNGTRLTDVLGVPVPEDRGFVEWNHRQKVGERFTFVGQAYYWSDSEVIRDFRRKDFTPVQTPDTFAEATYSGDNYIISLFTRAQLNPYHEVQQRLPELRFDLLPLPVGLGIYERGQASVAVLRDDAPTTAPTLRSDRLDAYYALTRPITPREWLSIEPIAGGRVTHYARADGGRDDYTRTLGELGVDAEMRISGTYDYKNEAWEIDGLRHLVTPRISYRYIPEAEKGRRYIPMIDRTAFSTYLQPLGLGDQRNIDELRGTNTLRLSLDNRLQTRDATYGSRDLVDLNLAADLRFDREPGERELGALHADLLLTPARWLTFELYQSLVPQDTQLNEFNTAMVLRDGNAQSLRLATHYLRGEIQEYVADYRYRFNEVYEGSIKLHYDEREKRFVEQTYGLRQTLDNLWFLQYEVSFYEGPRRESSFSFNLQIDLAVF